jgi:hypothetical protein
MRYLDIREIIELLAGTLLGVAVVWAVNHFFPQIFRTSDIVYWR